jgi:outer membrane protein assembly factor BamB
MTQSAPGAPGGSQGGWRVDAGYSAIDGHLVWGPFNRTLTPWTSVQISEAPAGEGVYIAYTNQKLSWTGYDITTGKELWTTQPKNSSWGYYDYCAPAVIGYGNLYAWGISGEVYAYNLETGKTVWGWNAGNTTDTPYGTWPLGSFPDCVLADGKLYVFAGHDYTPPVFKGAKIYCLNATTGEFIWSSLSFEVVGGTACADGVLVRFNGYDNQIYGYGKGPSKITVDAPSVGVTTATPITIKGTITDISAGSTQQATAANFPNGLPCVSDASQSQFMDAVYQQQQMPTNLTGVPVTINVVDANGNYRTIGSTVSNAYGTYSFTWTPDISGDYTVIASFAGTNSYYASNAAAAFHATESATGPTPQVTQAPSMADLYFMPMSIAIFAAIIVVGAVIVLALRKRP